MVNGWSRLDARLRLGAASGAVPQQFLFDLGGFSTLRGYGFKEFSGDRMVLLNAEYWMDSGARWLGQRRGFHVGVFADAGVAWMADGGEMDLQRSVGLAADIEDVRVYFARPLDGNEDGWEVSARLSRTF